jgi:hypothetical protein
LSSEYHHLVVVITGDGSWIAGGGLGRECNFENVGEEYLYSFLQRPETGDPARLSA